MGVILIATALGGVAATATATAGARRQAASSAAAAVVYGGVTPQSWPVVVEVSRNGRRMVRAAIGLDLHCSSGDSFGQTDSFIRIPINTRRRFSSSYGPTTTRNADGSTTDFSGTLRGAVNAARTRMSGTWEVTETFFSVGGAVTDTCKSGKVAWKAKQ